jgi:hypothetical protein
MRISATPLFPLPKQLPFNPPTNLKSPFLLPSWGLSTHRRNQPDSFYGCRNSTIFQAVKFRLLRTNPPSLSPHQPALIPPPKTTQIHVACLFLEGSALGFFFEPFLFGWLLIFWWPQLKSSHPHRERLISQTTDHLHPNQCCPQLARGSYQQIEPSGDRSVLLGTEMLPFPP